MVRVSLCSGASLRGVVHARGECSIHRYIQHTQLGYRKAGTLPSAPLLFPNAGPSSASRPSRVSRDPSRAAWLCGPLIWIGSKGRVLANQEWGCCSRGRVFPPRLSAPPRWVSAGATSLRPRPLDIPPRSLGPGGLVGHGLGRYGSSKTGPRSGRSALPPARLPDREGCLWLPAEEAREPGARGRPGAPPRSGWGLGRWAWRLGSQGFLFLGRGWVLLRVGTSGGLSVRAGGW